MPSISATLPARRRCSLPHARWAPPARSRSSPARRRCGSRPTACCKAPIWSSLGPWITATQPRFGDAIAERFADASRITPDLVGRFAPIRRRIAAGLEALLAPGTALLLPTAPCIAPRKDAPAAEIGEFYRRALTLTSGAGHAGLPQLSLPLAEAEGCPLGLSILGPRGSDASLLAVAARSQPARR